MKSCRGCGIKEYHIAPASLAKGDYLCPSCKRTEVQNRRAGISRPKREYRSSKVPQAAIKRAWKFVHKTETCWEWNGVHSDGYAMIWVGKKSDGTGRMKGVHIVFYEEFVGPIPNGLQIDHLCRNRGCVNPKHLEAVTQTENIRRGMSPSAISWRAKQSGNYSAPILR